MTSNYPNLTEFLGSYFHQDWSSESDSSLEAVELYLSEWPKDDALLAMQEISQLLASHSEAEISLFLGEAGCYFVPESENYASVGDWLRKVEQRMRAFFIQ